MREHISLFRHFWHRVDAVAFEAPAPGALYRFILPEYCKTSRRCVLTKLADDHRLQADSQTRRVERSRYDHSLDADWGFLVRWLTEDGGGILGRRSAGTDPTRRQDDSEREDTYMYMYGMVCVYLIAKYV